MLWKLSTPGRGCFGLLEIDRVNTRKNLLVGLILAFFAQGAVAQDTKIGVLNALQALFNSDAAQVVQTELEQEFALDEARATELTEQLQSLQSEYQQNEAVMTEDEIRRMNANAQDLQVQLQLIQERVQQRLKLDCQDWPRRRCWRIERLS